MLYNIFYAIAYMLKKQYLCSRIINYFIIDFMKTKQPNKQTKSVSISQPDARAIINFTKPFKTKEQWVAVVHNITRDIYELRGIDCFDSPIKEDYQSISQASMRFYNELCWMLNNSIMAETAKQRTNPEAAYLNK